MYSFPMHMKRQTVCAAADNRTTMQPSGARYRWLQALFEWGGTLTGLDMYYAPFMGLCSCMHHDDIIMCEQGTPKHRVMTLSHRPAWPSQAACIAL